MKALPGTVTFMAVSVVAFIILGSVLEGIPAIVLLGPLLFPIARRVIHEVYYAMVVTLAMGIGLAPPFGVYYAACASTSIRTKSMKPIVGYMVALFVGVVYGGRALDFDL